MPDQPTNIEALTLKIQALFNKAEGTPFPEEAKAFYAKAHQMMLQYAISEQQLRAAGQAPSAEPVVEIWKYGATKMHETASRLLASVIAKSNRCKTVFHLSNGTASIVGFPQDIAFSKTLFASIWVQAHCEAVLVPRVDLPSFMMGYADEIRVRLTANTVEEEKVASNALALRDISAQINDTFKQAFPNTQYSNFRTGGKDYYNGRDAGRKADISGGRNNIAAGLKGIGQ